MIIRQLKEEQYTDLKKALIQKAHVEPLEASFTVSMFIDGREYVLKLQPERQNKFAILQALKIDRRNDGPRFELITKGRLLSSFMEILIYQGVEQ